MTREERAEFARLYDDSPDTVGAWGELVTASSLRAELNIRVLRSLYIGMSQIDMVAISPYGVFVIENKNYHGVVIGDVRETYWNVRYTQGGKVYKLYNPVFQNQKHGEDVLDMLISSGFSKVPIYCPVIFNDGADLRITDPSKRVHTYKLADFIKAYRGVDVKHLVSEDIRVELANLFMKFQDDSEDAKKAHLDRIKAFRQDEKSKCP